MNKKTWTVQNFARYDALAIFLARSIENSRLLLLAPFLARYRSLSLRSHFRFGVYAPLATGRFINRTFGDSVVVLLKLLKNISDSSR